MHDYRFVTVFIPQVRAILPQLLLLMLLFLPLFGLATELEEAPFRIGLPLRCQPNQDCWIVNYVDQDPGAGVLDYGCGGRSYDGHDGTDFGIRDMAALKEGVAVVASAEGTAIGVRDGMPDISVNQQGREAIKNRECGNGVMIDHGKGWTTQYCHLRQGSVSVTQGAQVKAGQPLGLVGLSGLTEFPHVHLTLRHNGRPVDPFTGASPAGNCNTNSNRISLWQSSLLAHMPYRPAIIYNAGVAEKQPTPEEARNGSLRSTRLSPKASTIILWADILGLEAGDTITIRILDPQRRLLVEHKNVIDKRKAAWFGYAGKRRSTTWLAGNYHGEISLYRPKTGLQERYTMDFEVPANPD